MFEGDSKKAIEVLLRSRKRRFHFSAAGDTCAYCWDVETSKIKMIFRGHTDYFHCIVARNSSNQIITGSEDGTMRIWDCRNGKCINVIDPEKHMKSNEAFSWVSCIGLDASESCLACGHGRSLSVWNLPAFECISRIETRSPTQGIVFDDNQILAVGAETVNRFDLNGMTLSKIQCAPQSAFSTSRHPSGFIRVCQDLPILVIVSSLARLLLFSRATFGCWELVQFAISLLFPACWAFLDL